MWEAVGIPPKTNHAGRKTLVQKLQENGQCIKVGRGHRDACVGTWDLGTRDEGLEDIKYGTRGRVGRGRGDVKYRDAGDAGCE